MIKAPGSTDVTTYVSLELAADGAPAIGLTPANFDLSYVRTRAAPSTKVDATACASVDAAHVDNTVIEVSATDHPGVYRVDWPDAAFVEGVDEVILSVEVATARPASTRVQISVDVNVHQINKSIVAAQLQALAALAIYSGEVGSATSTTITDAGLTSGETNNYVGRVVLIGGGAMQYQGAKILAFNPGTDTLTVDPMTAVPAAAVPYLIV